VKLKYLYLSGNRNAIGGIALKDMVELIDLRIRFTNIKTFEFLEKLEKVYDISFEGNAITSIEGIENATYLRKIDFSSNYITDLSSLGKNINLNINTLYLENNYITNLSPLSNLDLSTLYIGNNCITNFTSIQNIKYVYGDSIEEQRKTCEMP
jgi:Leucine-rich repeat (LRR) protein